MTQVTDACRFFEDDPGRRAGALTMRVRGSAYRFRPLAGAGRRLLHRSPIREVGANSSKRAT